MKFRLNSKSADREARTVIERQDALILDFELQRIGELGWVVQNINGRDEHGARHQGRPPSRVTLAKPPE